MADGSGKIYETIKIIVHLAPKIKVKYKKDHLPIHSK